MPRFLLLAGTLGAALTVTPSAQTKRPMTIDDLIGAVRVSDPQLSPDNRRVLYVRTTTALDTGKRNADIWMVPADGSAPPRPFITGPGSDTSPRYTADGARVVFLSTRDGDTQVYSADADGQNVRRVTTLSGGVQPPLVVAPDGKSVAFIADVDPACADDECNKRSREARENDPVKMRRLTSLPYRHWDEWRLGVRHHVFVATIDGGPARDLTPGDFDSPPHNNEDNAITFSPDSRALAFVSNREGGDREMWTTNHDVWVVPVTGGTARKVTTGLAADVQPTYAPDAPLMAVRAQRRAGFESDRWYVDVYPLKTNDYTGAPSGAKRTLFETTDVSVEDLRFSRDGKSIWFTASDHGTDNLYVAPVAGGAPRPLALGGSISAIQPGSDFVIFARSTLNAPTDLFRVAADGATTTRLTNENASWRDGVDLPAIETFTAPGALGASIQDRLLKPPHFDASKKYPTVFLIHGGPQGAWLDAWSSRWNPALWAAQGWVVVAPNPRGSTGFGQKFVDDISRDWCGKVMTDLNGVFDGVSKLPYVDASKLGIAGASYGGYAVDWLLGHSNRFKVGVSHDGVFNLESMALATEELWFVEWDFGGPPWSAVARQNFNKCSPHLSVDKIKTPTLIITNEQDFRVPVDQGIQMFTALRRNGVPSEALIFQNEGHWVLGALDSRRWHESVFGWMRKYLEK